MGQHYVPEVHLKQFSARQGMTYVLKRSDAIKIPNYKVSLKAYRSYCQEADFYTIDLEKLRFFAPDIEIAPLEIEDKVNRSFEARYKAYITKFEEREELNIEDAKNFARLLIHMKLRNKQWRKSFNDSRVKSILTDHLQLAHEQLMTDPGLFKNIPKELKSVIVAYFLEEVRLAEDIGKTFQLYSLLNRPAEDTQLSNKIIQVIISSKWTIINQIGKTPFLTTDNPGFSIEPNGNLQNIKLTESAKFHFPLSATLCLVIDTGMPDVNYFEDGTKKVIDYKYAPRSVVFAINYNSSALSAEYIFASEPNALEMMLTPIRNKFEANITALE